MTSYFQLVLALVLVLANFGCKSAKSPSSTETPLETPNGPAWFEDVTTRVGVDFTHDPGPVGDYDYPQAVGSGCAATDLDGDGRPDLLFLSNGGDNGAKNKLYRQRTDGTFEDVSAGSGLDFAGRNMGVTVGDADNDGKPDVLITRYVGARLFRNLDGMRFADITESAGLNNPLWGSSACFLDYNRDGRLDLVIVNYIDHDPAVRCDTAGGERDFCAPKVFNGTVTKLFRNLGPSPGAPVRFEDVSASSGLARVLGPGLGVACQDFNGDGWPDIFVANDGKPNHLWVNQRDGTFKEEAVLRGVGYTMAGQAFAGMGVAVGDADNDGLADLFVTHLGTETNTFWRQEAPGRFRDQTAAWKASASAWRGTGFGALMADFNSDGYLDVAIVNGRVYGGPPFGGAGVSPFWEKYAERNQLLANDGGTRFRDVSVNSPAFCGYANVGRGLSVADLDGDGAPDLVATSAGGKAKVLRNVCPDRGHWLSVRCADPNLKHDAYGATVIVRSGVSKWHRVIAPGGSYLSFNSPTALFGLGPAAVVDDIVVSWPDGLRESFPGVAADKSMILTRGLGSKLPPEPPLGGVEKR